MKFVRNLIYILSCLGIVFPVNVFGVQVEIRQDMNLRRSESDGKGGQILKKEFLLRKGTVLDVDIDPSEIIYKSGSSKNIDFNATLNQWLKTKGINKSKYDQKGNILWEHFFPVTVVSSPDGKHKNKPSGFVALNVLALQDGLRLKTTEDTELMKPLAAPSSVATKPTAEKAEAVTDAGTCIGDCANDTGPITKLKEELATVFQKVQHFKGRFKEKEKNEFYAMKEAFRKTCFGLTFDQFVDYMKKKTAEKSIPPELVLSKMALESDGKCRAYKEESDGTASTGLLQINSDYSGGLGSCTVEQYEKLQGMSLSQMETNEGVRCIQNPALNLKRSLELFVEQYRLTNGTKLPPLKRWSEYSEQETDAFRFAQAGYNGGQVAINNAAKSVQAMAEEFGISLDKNDWETRRLFFFRKTLRDNKEIITGNKRSLSNSIRNIAYTEAILGRRSGNARVPGFIDIWENILFSANKD